MQSSTKPGNRVMPATAALVAELRAVFGAERIDAAIRAGQQGRREYRRRVAEHGQAEADAWLRRQRWPQGRFWASEGQHEVGVQAP